MLKVALTTVARKFDQGIFSGRKNPVTNERAISRESLMAFMEKLNIPVVPSALGIKRICLGGFNEELRTFLLERFSGDERVQIEKIDYGGDILIYCSRNPPDLLIADGGLSDIPCHAVIQSLRRRKELESLKILCLTKADNFQECLAWGADDVLAKDFLDGEVLAKMVYGLLGIPEAKAQGILEFEHHRQWPRINLNLPADITVYRLRAPRLGKRGKANLENISCGGAYLSQICMEKNELPAEPFKIILEVDQPLLQGFRAHCRVVRLRSNWLLASGVEFVKLSKLNRRKIEKIGLGLATLTGEDGEQGGTQALSPGLSCDKRLFK